MFQDLKKFEFEFNKRFFTKGQIMKEIDKKLREEGKVCQVVDIHYIIVDGNKYMLKEVVKDFPECSKSYTKAILKEVPLVNNLI